MYFGAKARFYDLDAVISELKPILVELHLTDNDIKNNKLNENFHSTMYSIHLPEYWEQVMIDPCDFGNFEKYLDIYKFCIEKSLKLKNIFLSQVKLKVVMHPGGATVDPLDINDLLWKKESLYKRLKSFIDCLEMMPVFKNNIEILVENMPPLPWFYGGQYYSNIFCDPLEIKSFCEIFERSICLDISHLGLYCNYKNIDLIDSIRLLKPYTKQIHIADARETDGEGVQIGEGNIDFNKVINEIKDLDIAIIPETMWGHCENFAGFKQTMSICNKLLGVNICP